MEENNDIRNNDVPIETVFRWKQVECWKLKAKVKKLEATVKALRNNITMLIGDKDLKKEIVKEAVVRQRNEEIKRLNKKLHHAYESIEELINSKLKLTKQLEEYEQESDR
jgi:predicted RNase H-like nuclease (RuvC/YqgF family)